MCQCKSELPRSDIEIDISTQYPQKKEIYLQDIASIEYVPLETTQDIIFERGFRIFHLSDQYIFALNRGKGDIFTFHRNGKIAAYFNHRGQGDEEYWGVQSIIFDERNNELYVFESTSQKVLVYSVTGEYQRSFKYPVDVQPVAYNFDEESILVYDEGNFHNSSFSSKPYMFLSKRDGSIISTLNLTLPVRYPNLPIPIPINRYDGRDFVIADISSDTIYQLTKEKKIIPLLIRIPSVHKSEPRIVWTSELKTEQFILLNITALDIDAARSKKNYFSTTLMHEFNTNETNEIILINSDFPFWDWNTDIARDVAIPQNMVVSLIDAPILKESYKTRMLNGELEQLVSTLDDKDIPLLMIIQFK